MLLQRHTTLSIEKQIKTPEEREIVNVMKSGIEISKFTRDDDKQFITFLGEWKVMIGDRRFTGKSKRESDELAVELVFIESKLKEMYPTITLPEIKLAVNMSLSGRLTVSAQIYNSQSFSVLYCSTIIGAYLEYKRAHLTPLLERYKYDFEQQQASDLTPEQKLDEIKGLFVDVYNEYKQSGEINDFGGLCYQFLKRTGRFKGKINKQEREKAEQYGNEQAKIFMQREDGSIKEAVAKNLYGARQGSAIDEAFVRNLYARNYCTRVLFAKLKKIEDLTETFTVQDLEVPKVPLSQTK